MSVLLSTLLTYMVLLFISGVVAVVGWKMGGVLRMKKEAQKIEQNK